MKKPASASSTRAVLGSLAAHAWKFKGRVIGAVAFLVVAKLAAVAVPLVLKRIVDALSRPEQLTALPFVLLAGYALMRFASTLFTELRDLVFNRVTQNPLNVTHAAPLTSATTRPTRNVP